VVRGRKVDQTTISEARAELSKEITPIDDIRSTSDYRLQVSLNLLEDFLQRLKSWPG
jgi:xanthine dehydrogenase iron-sulfur cluster and FAD-binding subunit A